jgi:hypothetical protein
MTIAWKSNMSRWCGHISTRAWKKSVNFGSVRDTLSRGMTASSLRCDSVWCEVSIIPARSRINTKRYEVPEAREKTAPGEQSIPGGIRTGI